mmetsp:Transcript_33979/g.66912  ORF Transcript_33979/g.66912 Transcript_33979/m.66912 type:complete len:277 (-) Transcript_33979:1177-2007(-)
MGTFFFIHLGHKALHYNRQEEVDKDEEDQHHEDEQEHVEGERSVLSVFWPREFSQTHLHHREHRFGQGRESGDCGTEQEGSAQADHEHEEGCDGNHVDSADKEQNQSAHYLSEPRVEVHHRQQTQQFRTVHNKRNAFQVGDICNALVHFVVHSKVHHWLSDSIRFRNRWRNIVCKQRVQPGDGDDTHHRLSDVQKVKEPTLLPFVGSVQKCPTKNKTCPHNKDRHTGVVLVVQLFADGYHREESQVRRPGPKLVPTELDSDHRVCVCLPWLASCNN